MIPQFTQSEVLPPFIGDGDRISSNLMSPYKTTIVEVVERYGSSKERISILQGLLKYREELRSLGILDGFQWLDGSFVENIEGISNRPPNDIDIVTFSMRPEELSETDDWSRFVKNNMNLFHPKLARLSYLCDAYYVDMSMPPRALVDRTRYWFGLFSHQRETYLWKGMLEISLACDDVAANELLNELEVRYA